MPDIEHDLEASPRHIGETLSNGAQVIAIGAALALNKKKLRVKVEPNAQPHPELNHPGDDMKLINDRREQGVGEDDIKAEIREHSLTYKDAQDGYGTGEQYLDNVMKNAHRSPDGQLPSQRLNKAKTNTSTRVR